LRSLPFYRLLPASEWLIFLNARVLNRFLNYKSSSLYPITQVQVRLVSRLIIEEDFRQALDAKLKTIASSKGTTIEDLHRQVVFNRFLARLDFSKFVLTGGYSLELRLPLSRSTTDLDLYARDAKLIIGSTLLKFLHCLPISATNGTLQSAKFFLTLFTLQSTLNIQPCTL